MITLGTIVAVTKDRIVVEKDTEGRLYLSRQQWCAPSLPRRNQRVEVNARHEIRPARIAPVWSVAEITRSF